MSVTTLNENLDIIQNLVIPFMEDDVDVVQKLDDEPNDVGGLSAAELKSKFDEAGNIIKRYINNTLVPQLSDTVAEAEERRKDEAQRQENEKARQEAEEARQNSFAEELAEAKRLNEDSEKSAGESADSATESESWAVGGTGKRPGEDTNNAKYWSEQARTSMSGDFATNNRVNQVEEEVGRVAESVNQLEEQVGKDLTALAKTVVSVEVQALNDAQKAQARANIGAVTVKEVIEALDVWEGGSY